MLYKLLSNSMQHDRKVEVISLSDRGQLGDKIEALGIRVSTIGMQSGIPHPLGIFRLTRLLRQQKPTIIQTWMYHSDLIGGWLGRHILKVPVVWNVRSNIVPFAKDKRTYLLTKAGAFFSSSIPTRIINCSEAARQTHVNSGYDATKMVTIPNGFDVSRYRVDRAAYTSVRRELGVDLSTPLIGLITRFDRRKDLPNFARAAGILLKIMPAARFLLCGNGISWENTELVAMIEEAGIRNACYLLGRRDDVPRLTAALHVATLSSASEAFPNVLGEAMACGVPCVATDVGDAALIVGETGIIVPPKDAQALAEGWKKTLTMSQEERVSLGLAARQRIMENFSLDVVVARYENLYHEVIAAHSRKN